MNKPLSDGGKITSRFPLAYGNEEETGIMVRFDRSGPFMQPLHFAESLTQYLPANLPHWTDGFRAFLGNGGLVYPGGSATDRERYVDMSSAAVQIEDNKARYDNIERATPECSSPTEMGVYVQAHEQLIVDMAQNYAVQTSKINERPTEIRIQRRVVDSVGNRKACHDNFGVPNVVEKLADDTIAAPLVGFIATRSFMTGAGYVGMSRPDQGPDSTQFAQKINGLEDIEGYGYKGYMYRVENEYGDERLEIRCNDINISPWAIRVRVGGIALMLATLDTPLKGLVNDRLYTTTAIKTAKQSNLANFLPDGRLQTTFALKSALDSQEFMADIFLEKLPHYVDLGDEYLDIATEIKEYCADFRAVLGGYLPLEYLADRSDFAAKFTNILANRAEDGKPLLSFESMRDDMRYDHIAIASLTNGISRVRKGNGYSMRDKGKFRNTPRDKDVQKAFYWAPSSTRATIRAKLIRTQELAEVRWRKIAIETKNGYGEIDLGNVDDTELTMFQQHAIEHFNSV